jgi:hypothetical protein
MQAMRRALAPMLGLALAAHLRGIRRFVAAAGLRP